MIQRGGTAPVTLWGDATKWSGCGGTYPGQGSGDTAVVTARLWVKGVSSGRAFNRRLWFSDTYVRTGDGWRYAFG